MYFVQSIAVLSDRPHKLNRDVDHIIDASEITQTVLPYWLKEHPEYSALLESQVIEIFFIDIDFEPHEDDILFDSIIRLTEYVLQSPKIKEIIFNIHDSVPETEINLKAKFWNQISEWCVTHDRCDAFYGFVEGLFLRL